MSDEQPDLGPCCICETTAGVNNIVLLDRRSVVLGHGWGCVVCDLPADGASAVLCDPCLALYRKEEGALRFACRGYPAIDGRISIAELSAATFDHDASKHAGELFSLTEAEVEQAINVGEDVKSRFNEAVKVALLVSIDRGVADHVFRSAVTTEALLLAAHMYSGDRDSFMLVAANAFATAQQHAETAAAVEPQSDYSAPDEGRS